MEVSQVVEVLLAWSEQHRLREEAFSRFEQWLESRGGTVGTLTRQEIQVEFYEQSLLFRTALFELGGHVWRSHA